MSPPRKGLAVASLVLGILGLPTFGLVGVGAVTGIILGVIALIRANRAPALYGGKGVAIGGIIANCLALALIPVIGIIAAIAIPSLLRARVSANEAAAIGDIRTVISAQTSYASSNGGYYDLLECLSSPDDCIPGYPAAGPTFLDAELASASVRVGYRRTFHPGAEEVLTEEQSAILSPTSLVSFAYVTVPENPGVTGVRAFCGDSTGRICQFPEGEVPSIVDGACPTECEVLQ
jgi:type II secretory pathway pseudopilin PulG